MARPMVLVLALSVLVTGCGARMSSGSRAATMIGGLAIATAGVFVAQPTAVDSDHNGYNDNPFNDDYSSFLPGLLLVAGGLVMTMAGATAQSSDDEAGSNTSVTPATAMITTPSVMITTPSAPVVVSSSMAPGLVAAPAIMPVAPAALPELPVDEATLALGKQVRTAASIGRCEHAWIMWRQLDERDHRYGAAIVAGDVMAPCRR